MTGGRREFRTSLLATSGSDGGVFGSSCRDTQKGGEIARGRLTGSRRCMGTCGRGRRSSPTVIGVFRRPASVSSRIMGRLATLFAGSAGGTKEYNEGRIMTSSSDEYLEAGENMSPV